ncbi:hypothetical protein DFH07DRAFT_781829 [Mycena maculata]|uniref:Uncharacterized protein n=1 Tax=Mycena maculata TaxID=230809 RepID=A0AAD7HYD4_9AGAR|nr:hypothetical protein DFH07DRAFT_781829 [Mycena maculata]
MPTVAINWGFLSTTFVLSADPFLLGMRRYPAKKLCSPPFTLGEPISGFGITVVLHSEVPGVDVGRYLYGCSMWLLFTQHHKWVVFQEYMVFPELSPLTILGKHPDLPWTAYIGAAGMPGRVMQFIHFQYDSGEVAFVTTGAGAVGLCVSHAPDLPTAKLKYPAQDGYSAHKEGGYEGDCVRGETLTI